MSLGYGDLVLLARIAVIREAIIYNNMLNITTHVTSLELSRRLKELNVPQTTMFWWTEWGTDEDVCAEESIEFHKRSDYPRVVFCHTQAPKHGVPPKSIITSAYLASELGELLPSEITEKNKNTAVFGEKAKSKYIGIDFFEDQVNNSYGMERVWRTSVGSIQFREKTEADARAKMLIYLLENHLISVEELGK